MTVFTTKERAHNGLRDNLVIVGTSLTGRPPLT